MTFFLVQTTCKTVRIQTKSWGYENSYDLGKCGSQQIYHKNFMSYEEECCQPAGLYTLTCKCSYGDGWHGGYLEINGTNYCEDFKHGYSKLVTVNFN